IILGLPGETPEDVQYTIDVISDLRPDDLTVHSLAIKRASRLHKWIEKNGFTSINNTDESMEIAARGAADMGMKPYYLYRQKNMSGNFENVGYALDGKAGIYNILIMEEKQSILALGAGSISKGVFPGGRIERCDDAKEVEIYMDNIEEMIARKRKLFGS
ncbi:MAG: coproporphyrinogen dehydrogenase HemZ, partial [Lachnospiraceae bacterium]|nr:coproporphyrinogen dehydrogenase HemZ [Lachnospiraceae bacterium]